jgi:hypothetical protein
MKRLHNDYTYNIPVTVNNKHGYNCPPPHTYTQNKERLLNINDISSTSIMNYAEWKTWTLWIGKTIHRVKKIILNLEKLEIPNFLP